jgi:putative ABC transport system substrate-binding protein
MHQQGDRLTGRCLLLFALVSLAACLVGSFGLASAADAQQPATPRRVGVLLVSFSPESKEAQAFRGGLLNAGYAEGRDVVIEWRSANGDYDRVPGLVADLVESKVDAIVVDTTVAALALKHATSTIPIVLAAVADPLGSGLVTSLAHPGGNVTGLSSMRGELSAKRLQLLKEVIPRLTRVAVLWNPDSPPHTKMVQQLKAVAPSLSIEPSFVGVRTPEEIGPAFATVSRAHAQALYVLGAPVFITHRTTLLKLASKAGLPTIYSGRQYADEGGLMSYGANYADQLRRAAGYVDKILKGVKPGDLPIEQPTKFELVVNLKTARAMGITIPESILLQADEVIK